MAARAARCPGMASNGARSEPRWFRIGGAADHPRPDATASGRSRPGSSHHSSFGRASAGCRATSRAQSSGRWTSKTRTSRRTGRCHRLTGSWSSSQAATSSPCTSAGGRVTVHSPAHVNCPAPYTDSYDVEAAGHVKTRRFGGAVPPLLHGDVDGLVQRRSEHLGHRLGDGKPFSRRAGRRSPPWPAPATRPTGRPACTRRRPPARPTTRTTTSGPRPRRAARRRRRCRGERRTRGRRREPCPRPAPARRHRAAPPSAPRRSPRDPTPSQGTSGVGRGPR